MKRFLWYFAIIGYPVYLNFGFFNIDKYISEYLSINFEPPFSLLKGFYGYYESMFYLVLIIAIFLAIIVIIGKEMMSKLEGLLSLCIMTTLLILSLVFGATGTVYWLHFVYLIKEFMLCFTLYFILTIYSIVTRIRMKTSNKEASEKQIIDVCN